MVTHCRWMAIWGLVACLAAGCGGGDSPGPAAETPAMASADTKPQQPSRESAPTVSISTTAVQAGHEVPAEPEKGSAEWLLREIVTLRTQPWPDTTDVEKLRTARRERNEQIIRLGTQCLAKTHDASEQADLFNLAARYMMEAQLQLALQGDREAIDSLYNDASFLYQHKPQSQAAADAAYIVAQFALTNAQRYSSREPRWLEEFSRTAQLFAVNFPQDEVRAAPLLFSAGRSCETHRLRDQALTCYRLLVEKFPESPQAGQVHGMIRRLTLPGQPLELAGPTIDGGYISVDDFRNRHVLVVFWASDAAPFLEDLSRLKEVIARFEDRGLAVIGVNLDEDEGDVDSFLEQHALGWYQLFHSDPARRRWNHPVVTWYGVRDLPTIWLVGRDGKVIETMLTVDRLEELLKSRL